MAGESFLPPIVARLAADIGEFQAKMGEARAEMEETAAQGGGSFSKLQSLGKGALLGLGGAAIAAGGLSIKMADDYESSHARLVAAVEASHNKMSDFSAAIDKQGGSFANLGYSRDQYEAGLARLTSATNEPGKALQYMGTVADLAAARHMSLEQAATLVGKVLDGNTTALQRYGIYLDTASGTAKQLSTAHAQLQKAEEAEQLVQEKMNDGRLKGANASDALRKAQENVAAAQEKVTQAQNAGTIGAEQLADRYKNYAAKQAETFHGQLTVMEAKLKNVGIAIGLWLIPKLMDAAKYLQQGISWIMQHKAALIALAVVIGGPLVAAIAAYVGGLIAAAAAQLVALAPMIATVVAIGALVAGILWLWTNWNQVWTWIKSNPALAIVIGLLGTLLTGGILPLVVGIMWLVKNWGDVWPVVSDVVNTAWGIIEPIFDAIMNVFNDVVTFVSDLINGNWSALWDDFTRIVGDGFNLVFQFFVELPGKLLALLAGVAGWLLGKGVDLLAGLLQGIINKLPDLAAWFANLLPTILGWMVGTTIWLLVKGYEILQGLVDGLVGKLPDLAAWFASLPGVILGWLASAATWLVNIGLQALGGLLTGMVNKLPDVVNFITNLPSTIGDLLLGLIDDFTNVGSEAMNGLWNGLKAIAGTVTGWVKSFASDMVSAITDPLHILSPSRVMHDVGVNIMTGLQQGMAAAAPDALAVMDSTATGIMNGPTGGWSSAAAVSSATVPGVTTTSEGPQVVHYHTHTGDIIIYAQDGTDAAEQLSAGFLNGRS